MYVENDCLYVSTEEYLAAGEWFEIMGLIEEGEVEVKFTKDGEVLPHGLWSLIKGYKPEVSQ